MKESMSEITQNVIANAENKAKHFCGGQLNYAFLSGWLQSVISGLPDTKENRQYLKFQSK